MEWGCSGEGARSLTGTLALAAAQVRRAGRPVGGGRVVHQREGSRHRRQRGGWFQGDHRGSQGLLLGTVAIERVLIQGGAQFCDVARRNPMAAARFVCCFRAYSTSPYWTAFHVRTPEGDSHHCWRSPDSLPRGPGSCGIFHMLFWSNNHLSFQRSLQSICYTLEGFCLVCLYMYSFPNGPPSGVTPDRSDHQRLCLYERRCTAPALRGRSSAHINDD